MFNTKNLSYILLGLLLGHWKRFSISYLIGKIVVLYPKLYLYLKFLSVIYFKCTAQDTWREREKFPCISKNLF